MSDLQPKKRKRSEESSESPKKFKEDDDKENVLGIGDKWYICRSPLERNSLTSSDKKEPSTTVSVFVGKEPSTTVSVLEKSYSDKDCLSELEKKKSKLMAQALACSQLKLTVLKQIVEVQQQTIRFQNERLQLKIKLKDIHRKKHKVESKITKEIQRQGKVARSREPLKEIDNFNNSQLNE